MSAPPRTPAPEPGRRNRCFATAAIALALASPGCGDAGEARDASGAPATAADSGPPADAGPMTRDSGRAADVEGAVAGPDAEDAGRVLVYDCGGLSFTVRLEAKDAEEAELLLPDRSLVLSRAPSASGARYSGDGTVFWDRGDEARLELTDRVFPDCSRDRPAESFEAARLRGARFRALGQEPGWLLDIYPGRSLMRLVADYGELEVETPVSGPRIDTEAGTRTYEAVTDAQRLTVVIEDRACRDAMSGFAFPRTVRVILDGRTLEGCGRPLGPAFIGAWSLVRFGSADEAIEPAPDTAPGLELDAWGAVVLSTGCNGLSGEWASEGPGHLSFGPLVGTKMACPAPRMEQETRFTEVLASTRAYTLAADTLRLTDAAGSSLAVFHRGRGAGPPR